MNLRLVAVLSVLAGMVGASPTAQTRVIPVAEVRPGMVGVGHTVFQGDKIEEFTVHIIGVLKNVVGPSRDIILARLEGGPLAETGVIAGMSGSPVYIDGRLLGAVSYQLGQFPKEPIAGITPIGEMTEATALAPAVPGSRPVALSWPPTPQELFRVWSQGLGGNLPVASAGLPTIVSGDPGLAQVATLLRPISVPLVAAGFSGDALGALTPVFTAHGFLPVSSSQAPARPVSATSRTLRPGDAMGVALLTGDFVLGATGTVTHVDGDRIYGFGHPMYNLGPTEFPLTQADVHVVLPSLMTSSKLASFGEVVGTVQQDRATAVAGRLGAGPSMIPVTITLNSDRIPSRTFSFSMVRDHTFTPLLTYLTVANVLLSYERGAGPASYTVKGTATVGDHGDIAFEDIFAGDQPANAASAYVAGPLTLLMRNAAEPVDVQKLALTIDASEQSRTARVERVWLDTDRPRAGRPVNVKVLLRTSTGEDLLKTIPIEIPAHGPSTMQLLVGDANRLSAEDRRTAREAETQEVAQLIRTFNKARRSNRLYVRLSSPDSGAVVNGEPLAALPPSVLAVLEADRNRGTYSPLRSATRGEWELPVELAISGSRQLTIALDQP
jgi:hypothetical protein